MNSPIKLAIVGYGLRGMTYADFTLLHSENVKLVAVAEIDPIRLNMAKNKFNLGKEQLFESAEEFFKQEKMADVVVISTQDRQHYSMAKTALNLGYDLLLEKPISPEIAEVIDLNNEAKRLNKTVIVCHVLKYTEFFNALVNAVNSNKIGKLLQINAVENVGYYHQAHSFVRGNWRNSKQTSPMILAKCSHDLDYIYWLADSKCLQLSSFGDTSLFKAENAPVGSAKRCLDNCETKSTCPYDAEQIYITGQTGILHSKSQWPYNAITNDLSLEGAFNAIKTGPYGRCVYHCDNDVVDHQTVNMQFENGIIANLTMCAFTSNISRHIRLMGSLGEIIADTHTNTIIIKPFVGEEEVINFNIKEENNSGHGGGDEGIMHDLMLSYNNKQRQSLSSIGISIHSHIMALAAEESRLNNGKAINISEFIARHSTTF